MTLVVSELSRHGIVMVGDSAITYSDPNGVPVGVGDGAAKVNYSDKANIGFAIWGNAVVQGQQLDAWLANFIITTVLDGEDLESVGKRIASQLTHELGNENRPWDELVFGIHLAGYKHDLPRLWHVHCGHDDEPAHEPRLYHDYPEHQGWTESYYKAVFFPPGGGGTASAHLRNGYTPHYALLFKSMVNYINDIRQSIGLNLPADSLDGHLRFHETLVKFVAGALVAAGEHPGVNDKLSSISFTADGLKSDARFPIVDWLHSPPKSISRTICRAWL